MVSQDLEKSHNQPPYGVGDATFCAAGGVAGIARLVDDFYRLMESRDEYRPIFEWHPDGETARDKLARFLSGWMGGPRRYQEKYGPINIPRVHAHLHITTVERDMWVNCMAEALELQPYSPAFKQYLLTQLSIPAEHIRRTCEGA